MKLIILLITLVTFVTGSEITHRIVNGAKADPHQFPYQATLLRRVGYFGVYRYVPFCGATIISDRWLLTAGHCTLGLDLPYDLKNIKVIIGVHKLSHEDRVVADVEDFFAHERFTMSPVVTNDIGLLKLKSPLALSEDGITPASLPESGEMFTGTAITSGHGLTNPRFQNSVSEHLLWLDINIIPDSKCLNRYEYRFSQTRFNPKIMICASAAPGKSPCNGDSGGPLVKKLDNGNYIIGVVSFGPKNCGQVDTPFVYTKVSAYRDWIKDKSGI